MNNYFCLVVLPNLGCLFGWIAITGVIICIVLLFSYNEKEHNSRNFAKTILKIFACSIALFFISCFIPTKKDILQIKAISVISELNGVEQIPQKLINKLNAILDAE